MILVTILTGGLVAVILSKRKPKPVLEQISAEDFGNINKQDEEIKKSINDNNDFTSI